MQQRGFQRRVKNTVKYFKKKVRDFDFECNAYRYDGKER